MPRTALDLITASLKRLNVISGIETPTADLAQDALERLNDLLATWRTESLTIWALTTSPIPIVVGTNPYLLGPAGVVPRPEWIEGVNVLMSASTNFELPLTRDDTDDWRLNRTKALTGPQPTHFHYEPDWPEGKLFVWPVPSGGNSLSLILYVPEELPSVPTLTTVLDLPPGYYRAMRDNLAIELAPELGRTVEPSLQYAAVDALAAVKRHNFRPRTLEMPAAMPALSREGVYDWRTDT